MTTMTLNQLKAFLTWSDLIVLWAHLHGRDDGVAIVCPDFIVNGSAGEVAEIVNAHDSASGGYYLPLNGGLPS